MTFQGVFDELDDPDGLLTEIELGDWFSVTVDIDPTDSISSDAVTGLEMFDFPSRASIIDGICDQGAYCPDPFRVFEAPESFDSGRFYDQLLRVEGSEVVTTAFISGVPLPEPHRARTLTAAAVTLAGLKRRRAGASWQGPR